MSLIKHCLCVFALVLFAMNIQAGESDWVGKPAPDFTLRSEGGGSSGENIKLSDLKGQVVLLNFWASWCGPCRKEMPLLNDLHNKFKELGVTVLGINVESEKEMAMDFLSKTPVDFPILLDPTSSVVEAYRVDAMPTTLVIDRDGMIRTHHRGYKDGYEALYEADLETLAREM